MFVGARPTRRSSVPLAPRGRSIFDLFKRSSALNRSNQFPLIKISTMISEINGEKVILRLFSCPSRVAARADVFVNDLRLSQTFFTTVEGIT
jgi:hypothetical protein